ncbi:hypothetical protein B484DRAFT_445977 [Ochromonadaceae sp. CCMP2298]|nr:hypothetical protein B484DRAFT_445977 [Ochromonadaceae sp. CCMP2298]
MEGPDIPLLDLVLIGGGHAHVHVMKMFGMNRIPGLRITLISKDMESPYSGMVPGYVAGYYTSEESHIDLAKLSSFAGIRMFHVEVTSLDTATRLIYCRDGRPAIKYDLLSINIGIVPRPLSLHGGSQQGAGAAGAGSANAGVPGPSPSITPVKPIDKFTQRWETILTRVLAGSFLRTFTIAVVGGGAGGVELAFAVHTRVQKHLLDRGLSPTLLKVLLLNRGERVMPSHCASARTILLRLLAEKGVGVHTGADICGSEPGNQGTQDTQENQGSLVARDGRRFPCDEVFWCTQAVGHPWLRETGLACSEDGFICIKPTLESTSTKGVFAAGDICHNVEYPRPKAGVFAVRAGPPLYANLRRSILGEPLVPWEPQVQFLGIIGTGDGYAVATKGDLGLEGAYLWTLKDKIDRDWMRGYQELPDMEQMRAKKEAEEAEEESRRATAVAVAAANAAIAAAVAVTAQFAGVGAGVLPSTALSATTATTATTAPAPAPALSLLALRGVPHIALGMGQETIDMLSKAKMRCGGCGSKVGAQVLTRALRRIRHLMQHGRSDIVSGPGDDAALVLPPPAPAILVQTIDYFRSFIGDPYVMGQIAANHALSDVYAMNASPVSALALCVLPYGPEEKVEESLVHMLAGALVAMRSAGCALVGGHTSEGAEAALGFAITGTVLPSQALPKGPLVPPGEVAAGRAGEYVLLLTKALGTGTLLAADMRGKARGGWVSAAIESMVQSNQTASGILHGRGCVACTDVTGFGFMGHLLEMLQYGEEDADVDADVAGAGVEAGSQSQALAADVYLDQVPTLPGAAQCIAMGVVSSLQPQNIRCARAVDNVELGRGDPTYPLLYDPQTSGGLLASLPVAQAEAALAELRAAGYGASAVVGRVRVRERGEFAGLVRLVRQADA